MTIKAYQYDLVCNGFEIASGGIRNHKPDTMIKAFEIAGLSKDVVEDRFGGLYRAFQYGAPPHGGMAAGVDRVVMLLCGTRNLREITLFPMNQQAADLLMGAPSEAEPRQLRELHVRLNIAEGITITTKLIVPEEIERHGTSSEPMSVQAGFRCFLNLQRSSTGIRLRRNF